jgi:hypothetical protein
VYYSEQEIKEEAGKTDTVLLKLIECSDARYLILYRKIYQTQDELKEFLWETSNSSIRS